MEWSVWQWIAAVVLSGDLVGGVVVNASAPARRYYFRPGRTRRDHLAFVALHLVHVVVFTWLFRAGDGVFAVVLSAGLLLAATLIRTVPIHLRRPVAMLCLVIGIVGSTATSAAAHGAVVIGSAVGMEWFVPVLLLKLLVCHLLGDVPAAPRTSAARMGSAQTGGA